MPIFHQMVQGRGEIVNGDYVLPKALGWGLEFDADFIKRNTA